MESTKSPSAAPRSADGDREDAIYQHQITDNKPAAMLLTTHRKDVENQALTHQIDPDLINTVILHESRGDSDTFRRVASQWNWIRHGTEGTYGYAHLGSAERQKAGLDIQEAETLKGSIKGTAVWLDTARRNLLDAGVAQPTNQQILERFYANKGRKDGVDAKRAGWTLDQIKAGALPDITPSQSERQKLPDQPLAEDEPKAGAAFPDFVVAKLKTLAPMVSKSFNNSNRIAQLATLKFIGEEYSTRKGFKGFWDAAQDFNASTGSGGTDLGFRDVKTHLPTLGIPEDYRRGPWWQKGLSEVDFLHHDVGPANINVGSASKMAGMIEPEDINRLAKELTSDEGTAKYAARFVALAQRDLAPLIKGMSEKRQVQIITDYVRSGGDHFWNSTVVKSQKLSPEQVQQWRQAPDTFKRPDGTSPTPLRPNPDHYILQHFDQLDGIMGQTKR